ATKLGRPSRQQPRAGDGDDAGLAGSILEGAVDIRIAERQRPQAEGPGKHPEIALRGQLRRSVRGQRLWHGSLRRWQVGGPAVDGATGGGEDEAAAAGIGARLEEGDGPQHVDYRVAGAIAHGSGHATL